MWEKLQKERGYLWMKMYAYNVMVDTIIRVDPMDVLTCNYDYKMGRCSGMSALVRCKILL